MVYDTGSSSMDKLFQSNDRPVWDMLSGNAAQRLPAGKWRNPDRNERAKESETPPKRGQERQQNEPAKEYRNDFNE